MMASPGTPGSIEVIAHFSLNDILSDCIIVICTNLIWICMSSLCISPWIMADEPTDVSSMAHYKDGYEDILQERREKSDLKYSLRARPDVPKYKYRNARSPEDLKNHVINSDRVKYTVEKVSFAGSAHVAWKCEYSLIPCNSNAFPESSQMAIHPIHLWMNS